MYAKMIETLKSRPTAYMPNAYPIWEDAHISTQMLAAHLNPELDAATRNHAFVRASARWIASLKKGGALLDLGCGPGIYAEAFDGEGFEVTGMDFSEGSIAYARASAEKAGKGVRYVHQNYLSLALESEFDVVTLIYCDFGVLAPDNRRRLLRKIHRALKPGGLFIMDVFTRNAYSGFSERRTVSFEKGGFWSPEEYICVKCDCLYGTSVILEQYNVITAETMRTYNLWNEMFDQPGLARLLHQAGFTGVSFYGDVAGAPCAEGDRTLCAVGIK